MILPNLECYVCIVSCGLWFLGAIERFLYSLRLFIATWSNTAVVASRKVVPHTPSALDSSARDYQIRFGPHVRDKPACPSSLHGRDKVISPDTAHGQQAEVGFPYLRLVD